MSDEYITPGELATKMASADPPVVIDVRSADEYAAGHIPGSLHIPGDQLAGRLHELPVDQPVVTY